MSHRSCQILEMSATSPYTLSSALQLCLFLVQAFEEAPQSHADRLHSFGNLAAGSLLVRRVQHGSASWLRSFCRMRSYSGSRRSRRARSSSSSKFGL